MLYLDHCLVPAPASDPHSDIDHRPMPHVVLSVRATLLAVIIYTCMWQLCSQFQKNCRPTTHHSVALVARRHLPAGGLPGRCVPTVGDRAMGQRGVGGRPRGGPGGGVLAPRRPLRAAGVRGIPGPDVSTPGGVASGRAAAPRGPPRLSLPESRPRSGSLPSFQPRLSCTGADSICDCCAFHSAFL